jgi:NADH-quinone oxidoreductase subunit N
MTNIDSLVYFIPELILTVFIVGIVLVDVFSSSARRSLAVWWIALVGLAATAVTLFIQPLPGEPIFFGALVSDGFSQFFKWLFLIATAVILVVSPFTAQLDKQPRNEYYVFLLLVVFGMFLMTSANDLIMVYLSLEIVSVGSFILAGFLKDSRASNESSLKYVIYGAFSSGMMLFGFSLLFGMAGSTDIGAVKVAVSNLPGYAHITVAMSLMLILVGFGYKISMVPFHFWTPDVYQGAPTTITAFLSVAPKAAGFALTLRVLGLIFGDYNVADGSWMPVTGLAFGSVMAVFAALTMTVGNVLAVQQSSVKRLLAYSSIAHAGYMLMALTVFNERAVQAVMFYLAIYMCMNLGAFLVAIFVHNKFGVDEVEEWKGLGFKAPLIMVPMGIFLFSLTGLPPTAGFIGKVYIFSVLVEANRFWWLAVLGVLNSVVSLYYYVRIIKVMFLDGEPSADDETVSDHPALVGTILVLMIPVLLLGIYWNPLLTFVQNSFNIISQSM